MPRKVITDEQDKEMRRLGGLGWSAKRISKQLKLSYSTCHMHMQKNGIERGIDMTKRNNFSSDKRITRRKNSRAGYFNEHERDNWLA